jgi:hypothetical protein
MQRLEITGETPEALYFNVVKTLSIFLRGAPGTPAASEAAVVRTSDAATSAETVKPNHDENDVQLEPGKGVDFVALAAKSKAKKGAKPKVEKLVEDEIGDLGVGKTIEHEPKVLTLDGDIRPRLQAIQKAHTERGHDMPAVVAYIQQLYGPFGIAKIPQLRPEQFEDFMDASEGYLSGEA